MRKFEVTITEREHPRWKGNAAQASNCTDNPSSVAPLPSRFPTDDSARELEQPDALAPDERPLSPLRESS
jgi:hypothetical protein